MLILAKAMMAIMLGFVIAIVCGLVLIPMLRKFHIGQQVYEINERHLKKKGTPTMGV
jgi:UDP-N-acetylmuramyl pentapeptide phosphotransferase/UDP-N-acetylglucosamine-1-phosphate transferase